MRRRRFIGEALAGFGAVMALPAITTQGKAFMQADALIKPKALKAGDTVGLITPGTAVTDPDRLALAAHTLKYFGLKSRMGKNVGKRHADYQSSVKGRVDDLHEMFADREVDAVFAIRGGYGCSHLLDQIDYALIKKNPKIFLGYSDITALHLAMRQTGLVTFHGPVAVSSFTQYTQSSFHKALFDARPIGKLTNPEEDNKLRPNHTLRTVIGGRASGRLAGGNLSLIAATMGTPYEIDTRGKILFIEDVDEEPYNIDRMLTHLRLAGKFNQAAGVIFGECADCKPNDFKASFASPYTLGEIVDNILGGLKVPVLSGLTIGHTEDQLTLPLGLMARLDADSGTLDITESAVI